MITAQQKIEYVASKLGLDTLYQMQGSTGAVYDVDTENVGQCFTNSSQHQYPTVTNINSNRFEVNEALLIEMIGVYSRNGDSESPNFQEVDNLQRIYGSDAVIVFDLIIGNKRVLRDTPIFLAGNPTCFASGGFNVSGNAVPTAIAGQMIPRNQIYLEGVGILIPPQVEWNIQYRVYNLVTGAQETLLNTGEVGFYLYGTKVQLNFNTTL
jgi:hypothetical protein